METVKWVLATALAIVAAILGAALALGAMFFSVVVQIFGGIILLTGLIIVYIKERLLSKSDNRFDK